MKNIIKKADIVLFVILVLLGIFFTVFSLFGGGNKTKVVIKVDGEVYGTYSLNRDRTITIDRNGNHNEVVIKDGHVQMMESSCSNQICVNQGQISAVSIPIVCLPNGVMVQIVDGEEGYDVITG